MEIQILFFIRTTSGIKFARKARIGECLLFMEGPNLARAQKKHLDDCTSKSYNLSTS